MKSKNIILIMLILVFFGVLVAVVGFSRKGSASQGSGEVSSKINISRNRIYLKGLTTGDSVKSKNFPKYIAMADGEISFDYSFFGVSRPFRAKVNLEDRVFSYEVSVGYFEVDELRSAIEGKMAIDNGSEVKFNCALDDYSVGDIELSRETCRIISGRQVLSVVKSRPTSRKRADIPVALWEALYTGVVRLEESIDISAEGRQRLKEERIREDEIQKQEKMRAQNDV